MRSVYHSDEKDMIPERLKTLELILKKTAETHKLEYPLKVATATYLRLPSTARMLHTSMRAIKV